MYPVQSVKVMDLIASIAEDAIPMLPQTEHKPMSAAEVIGECISLAVKRLDIDAIIVSTKTGFSCRMIAKYRPKTTIIATTPFESVFRRLSLIWGVIPLLTGGIVDSTDVLIYEAILESLNQGHIQTDDTIICTAGSLLGLPAIVKTNLFQIYHVGTVIDSAHTLHRFDQISQ
jgi:pyruvate kinase